MRYPEMLQFRVPPGTAFALEAVAAREGRKLSDVAREAISNRIAALFCDLPTTDEAGGSGCAKPAIKHGGLE